MTKLMFGGCALIVISFFAMVPITAAAAAKDITPPIQTLAWCALGTLLLGCFCVVVQAEKDVGFLRKLTTIIRRSPD